METPLVPTEARETARLLAIELLERMGFAASVSVEPAGTPVQGSFVVTVSVENDSNLLIGQRGVNLLAFQHLLRLLARHKGIEDTSFTVDINAYWAGKQEVLFREAAEAAEEALRLGAPAFLRPMSNYERKVVHTALAQDARVVTESVGQGDERKVAVKPAPTAGLEAPEAA